MMNFAIIRFVSYGKHPLNRQLRATEGGIVIDNKSGDLIQRITYADTRDQSGIGNTLSKIADEIIGA